MENYNSRDWSFHCAVLTLDRDHLRWGEGLGSDPY